MKRGSTDAETCRLNGWVVGTRLVGEERGKLATITITAIGRANVLAIRDGWSTESVWSLSCREWRLAPDTFARPAEQPGESTDKSLPELLGITKEATREFFGKWPEPNRCGATLGSVRCGLDERHIRGGPKSHCANPSRGDGSTWTGPGFIQWRDEPP